MLIDIAAFVAVFAFSLFLLTLAVLLAFYEERGKGVLLGFASSATAHYLEISLRVIIGTGFVVYASKVLFGTAFLIFGWILIITSAGLALIPWRWHNYFASCTVPQALKYPKILAAFSAAMGSFVIFSLIYTIARA